jgi:hypothetical protein
MPESPEDPPSTAKPFAVRLRLALAPWTVHFKNPGYIQDRTMVMLEGIAKKTLEDTRRNHDVR